MPSRSRAPSLPLPSWTLLRFYSFWRPVQRGGGHERRAGRRRAGDGPPAGAAPATSRCPSTRSSVIPSVRTCTFTPVCGRQVVAGYGRAAAPGGRPRHESLPAPGGAYPPYTPRRMKANRRVNPFTPGKRLTRPDVFSGRTAQLEDALGLLRQAAAGNVRHGPIRLALVCTRASPRDAAASCKGRPATATTTALSTPASRADAGARSVIGPN